MKARNFDQLQNPEEVSQNRKDAMREKIADHWKNKVMKVDDQDKRVYEIAKDVPKVHKIVAVLCFLINVFIPGFGTMTAACAT